MALGATGAVAAGRASGQIARRDLLASLGKRNLY